MTARCTPGEDLQRLLDSAMGRVHNQDVGALLGVLARAGKDLVSDVVLRRYWLQAVCAALAPDARGGGRAVRWTYLVSHTPQARRVLRRTPAVRRLAQLRPAV